MSKHIVLSASILVVMMSSYQIGNCQVGDVRIEADGYRGGTSVNGYSNNSRYRPGNNTNSVNRSTYGTSNYPPIYQSYYYSTPQPRSYYSGYGSGYGSYNYPPSYQSYYYTYSQPRRYYSGYGSGYGTYNYSPSYQSYYNAYPQPRSYYFGNGYSNGFTFRSSPALPYRYGTPRYYNPPVRRYSSRRFR